MMEVLQLQASADAVHVLAEVGAEGQGMNDVGGLFHDRGHGHGLDDAPCLPNDRVHARPREGGSVEGPWVCGPLFPVPVPFPFPCLYLSRAHGTCLPCQGRGQAQTREQESQTMSRAQIRTSRGHVVYYSHDHDLVPYQEVAGEAANWTSPELRRHLAVRPSVGERGDPERAPELG